jgi:Bacterial Ig-like domain (group 2)/Bacterial Ig domain
MRRSQPDLTLLAGDSTFNASLLFILICSMVALGSCGGGSAPQTANVISLTISPQFVFLTVANTQQLSASEMLSNGSSQAPQSPQWTSSNPNIASVSAQGLVSAVAQGTVTISCSDSDATGSTTLNVEPAFSTSAYQSGTFLYLENTVGTDIVRLGMDMSLGGAVSEFSLNGADVVAKASYGSHLFAVGLYDGNGTYDSCNGCTGTYGWNPVESGDYYRHGSPILGESISGDTIYIEANALQWIPDDKGGGPTQPVLSDIIVERWFSPVANHPYVFHERYKITHIGTDSHADANEAVPDYEVSALLFDQFDFYTGTNPGVGAAPTVLPTAQMAQFPALGTVEWLSEHWAALTNQQGVGFAAYSPQAFPYSTPSQATSNPAIDEELAFPFLTPFSFTPGSSVQFDTFLMLGSDTTMQLETYDIKRDLGPFADIAPPIGSLDLPAKGSTVEGMVSVQGWAFDSASSTTVDLYVDGALTSSGAPSIARPDIVAAYPGAPANSGYQFNLDTTQLPNGQHTIEVRAADASGNIGLLPYHTITVKN